MWKYTHSQINIDKAVIKKLKKYTKVGGVVSLLLGTIGILFPTFMTLSTVILISYLMLFAGMSLFFDDIALLSGGIFLNKMEKE